MSTRRTEEQYYIPDKAKITAGKTARAVQAEKRRDRLPTDQADNRHCATEQVLQEEAMNLGGMSELGTSDDPIFQSEEMAESITQNFRAHQTQLPMQHMHQQPLLTRVSVIRSGQTAHSGPQRGNPTHMSYPAHTGMASMGSSGLP